MQSLARVQSVRWLAQGPTSCTPFLVRQPVLCACSAASAIHPQAPQSPASTLFLHYPKLLQQPQQQQVKGLVAPGVALSVGPYPRTCGPLLGTTLALALNLHQPEQQLHQGLKLCSHTAESLCLLPASHQANTG
jgi:hypothetical protein